MKKYVCDTCGWEYDPEVGFVCKVCGYIYEGDVLPDDFVCPLCGVGKDEFSPVE